MMQLCDNSTISEENPLLIAPDDSSGRGVRIAATEQHQAVTTTRGSWLRPLIVALALMGLAGVALVTTARVRYGEGLLRVQVSRSRLQLKDETGGSEEVVGEYNVMTWNMACRGFGIFIRCDNCEARFKQIAEAVMTDGKGYVKGSGYQVSGMPDFSTIDTIVAQEIFLTPENLHLIDVLDEAFGSKGFKRVHAPGPEKTDAICGKPLMPDIAQSMAPAQFDQPNGGLVTWTKLEVLAYSARRWCKNLFPAPHGYTISHLLKDGVNIFQFNSHLSPEFNFGSLKAEVIRGSQFPELVNEAEALAEKFAGKPFVAVYGGDSNEDLYHLEHKGSKPDCGSIPKDNPNLLAKLALIGIDAQKECEEGKIGYPTWDVNENDIAYSFHTATMTDEDLDYLSVIVSSSGHVQQPQMTAHNFKLDSGWDAQICSDPTHALGCCEKKTMYSLSDHFPVTVNMRLYSSPGMQSEDPAEASLDFQSVVTTYDSRDSACGQEDIPCVPGRGDCCEYAKYSLNGRAQQCWLGMCAKCQIDGESCSVDADCCGYKRVTGDEGPHLYCNMFKCTQKEPKGGSCGFDDSCDSGDCSWFTCK